MNTGEIIFQQVFPLINVIYIYINAKLTINVNIFICRIGNQSPKSSRKHLGKNSERYMFKNLC